MPNQALIRIIKMLLDEVEKQADTADRIAALEAWQEQVEAQWPLIGGDNGTD